MGFGEGALAAGCSTGGAAARDGAAPNRLLSAAIIDSSRLAQRDAGTDFCERNRRPRPGTANIRIAVNIGAPAISCSLLY
jgi:hypothetical protein